MYKAKRKLQRNFVTSLGNDYANNEQKALLKKYKGLSRFDNEKQTLLDAWAKDKSAKWYVETETKQEKISKTESSSANGYGTKFHKPLY